MNRYNELLGKKKDLKYQIYLERRKLHKEFVAEHYIILKFLDLLFACCILFNFGALVITDYMVESVQWEEAIAQNKTIVYQEANPAAAEIHNYQTDKTPEGRKQNWGIIFALFKQAFLWCLMIGAYILVRVTMKTKIELYMLCFIVPMYFSLLGMDFFHDLGLFIAKLRYG